MDIVKMIMIMIPLISVLFTVAGYIFTGVYHEEIQEYNAIIKFKKAWEFESDDRLKRIMALEGKHSKGHSVGLRWNAKEEKMQYRDEDKKLHDAFIKPETGRWSYINSGGNVEIINK